MWKKGSKTKHLYYLGGLGTGCGEKGRFVSCAAVQIQREAAGHGGDLEASSSFADLPPPLSFYLPRIRLRLFIL